MYTKFQTGIERLMEREFTDIQKGWRSHKTI
jgi:hypothetical protein